jgi:hypothetical protein
MTAKLNTGCSVVVPPVVLKDILNDPAPTAVTWISFKSVPDFWLTTTVSVSATTELVTVKDCQEVDPAAEKRVIAPVGLFSTTVVVLFVS